MAKNKPAAFKGAGQKPGDARGRRAPQTEEKAKGLIGLKGGKKVEGAAYSVGNYKGKTLNLSAKQIAKSGVKGAKAASKNTVSISDTKYEKGKGVLDKSGKALSGTVDLGGGNMAVYVNGKRVRAAAAKPKPATPARGGSSGGSRGGSSSAGGGTTAAKPKGGNKAKKGPGPTMTNFSVPARNTGGAGRPANDRRNSWASGVIAATGLAPSTPNRQNRPAATAAKPRPSVSATAKPREGQRQTRMVGNRRVVEVYRGGRWVPLTGSRGG